MAGNAVKKPWKVYFEGSIWGHRGRDHAGREIPVNKTFSWGNQTWVIPAVYVCARGLVLDLCASVDADEMRVFVEKWLPYERMRDVPEEVQEEIERQHPLRIDGKAVLICDGRRLRKDHASGSGWLPESIEGYRNGAEAEAFLSHYGLDRERAWAFRRIMFPWTTKRGPRQVREVTLCMEAGKVSYSGPHFTGQEKTVTFSHSLTGKEYTLTVLGEEEQEISERHFQREDLEYPRKCVTLGYTVDPPHEGVQVRWCAAGDRPRATKERRKGMPSAAHAVGVILQQKNGEKCAASALYFTLPEKREWRIAVMEKPREDVEWRLLGEKK